MVYLWEFFFSCRHFTLLAVEGGSLNCCRHSLSVYFIHMDPLLAHPFLKEMKFALEASDGVVKLSNVSPN